MATLAATAKNVMSVLGVQDRIYIHNITGGPSQFKMHRMNSDWIGGVPSYYFIRDPNISFMDACLWVQSVAKLDTAVFWERVIRAAIPGWEQALLDELVQVAIFPNEAKYYQELVDIASKHTLQIVLTQTCNETSFTTTGTLTSTQGLLLTSTQGVATQTPFQEAHATRAYLQRFSSTNFIPPN